MCIPPGARLRVEGPSEIPVRPLRAVECELATFTQLSAETNQHRDALCFDDGAVLQLARLAEGQRVKVLRLSCLEDWELTPRTTQRLRAV